MTPPGRARILVVEDVADITSFLVYLCELEGYAVETAASGAEALAAAGAGCDLVLLDLLIPPPDGFEVARSLRTSRPHLPILALTALTWPEVLARAYAAGVDEVVTKPFDPDLLLARMAARLAGERRAERWDDVARWPEAESRPPGPSA